MSSTNFRSILIFWQATRKSVRDRHKTAVAQQHRNRGGLHKKKHNDQPVYSYKNDCLSATNTTRHTKNEAKSPYRRSKQKNRDSVLVFLSLLTHPLTHLQLANTTAPSPARAEFPLDLLFNIFFLVFSHGFYFKPLLVRYSYRAGVTPNDSLAHGFLRKPCVRVPAVVALSTAPQTLTKGRRITRHR